MATAVFFHAHPDDEALFTGGSMSRAAAEGHRVVLVTATRGECGHDFSGEGDRAESLGARRAQELAEAGRILGVARSEILGFADSGRDGTVAGGFCRTDPVVAAARLADILEEESADVFVTYDERGGYGHPDHIQAHCVGLLAARRAQSPAVFLSTIDGDHVRSLLAMARAFNFALDDETRRWAETAGVAGRPLTTVDVTAFLGPKRRAMAAHRTQLPEDSFLMSLPAAAFELVFGREWYLAGSEGGKRDAWLFD